MDKEKREEILGFIEEKYEYWAYKNIISEFVINYDVQVTNLIYGENFDENLTYFVLISKGV